MSILDTFKNMVGWAEKSAPVAVEDMGHAEVVSEVTAVPTQMSTTVIRAEHLFTISESFDGEKNFGDLGPIKNYTLDYDALRARGWQLFLESEICQLVILRFARWVVSKGLMLKAQPNDVVLESLGVDLPENFNEQLEARWQLFASNNRVDIKGESTLDQLAKKAFVSSRIGGDCLVILRVVNGSVQVQLVEGENVATPARCKFAGLNRVWDNGNKVINGVELDANGKHVAYHIVTGLMSSERVVARDSKGRRVAFLVTGLKYKLSSTRAMPLITAVMETASKLDRYKEATVGSAEEAAKVAIVAEHNPASTGENPLTERLAQQRASRSTNNAVDGSNPVDVNGRQLASTVAATTGKQLINMPIDSTLKSLESKKEIHFADFYLNNIDVVCSVVGIPPEVARMKYDSNFSASRAALKDWEHTLMDERLEFAQQFYRPIYEYWLDVQVLANRVSAPGYVKALGSDDYYVLDAYRVAQWLGANVPHIDPVKEVRAEREKLGPLFDYVPLATVEKATYALNGGDYWENQKNAARELEEVKSLGMKPVEKVVEKPAGKPATAEEQ